MRRDWYFGLLDRTQSSVLPPSLIRNRRFLATLFIIRQSFLVWFTICSLPLQGLLSWPCVLSASAFLAQQRRKRLMVPWKVRPSAICQKLAHWSHSRAGAEPLFVAISGIAKHRSATRICGADATTLLFPSTRNTNARPLAAAGRRHASRSRRQGIAKPISFATSGTVQVRSATVLSGGAAVERSPSKRSRSARPLAAVKSHSYSRFPEDRPIEATADEMWAERFAVPDRNKYRESINFFRKSVSY